MGGSCSHGGSERTPHCRSAQVLQPASGRPARLVIMQPAAAAASQPRPPATGPTTAAHLELDNLPFPALTPAQRYHYEVYGWVLLPEVLSAAETATLLGELHELRADLLAQADAAAVGDGPRRYPSPVPGGAVLEQRRGPGPMDGLQNLSQVSIKLKPTTVLTPLPPHTRPHTSL